MFRPERLTSARTLVGCTQAELAKMAGVGQSMVSMVESHQREFSAELAEAFANALALPVEYFSVSPKSIPRDSLHYRKQSKAKVSDTKRIHEYFAEGFRVVETLMETSDYPRPMLPLVQDQAERLSIERIEEIAQQVRETLGLDTRAPITNVTRALERIGIVVAPLAVDGEVLSGHSGVSWSAGRGEPAMIAVNYVKGDRDRFTVAHELGHLVLHSFRSSEDPEAEANRFAGAFLVPFEPFKESISATVTLTTFRRLKAQWGVSIQALLVRATDLGLIGSQRSQTLWKQISARGWRQNEPVEVGLESPRLFLKLLQESYGPSPLTHPNIVHELALPLLTLRSLAPLPPKKGTDDSPFGEVISLGDRRSSRLSRAAL